MRLDSLLLGEKMEASLSVQPQEEGASRIQSSRDGSSVAVGRGRSARPSWFRRALGGLLLWKHPAAVEAPAPALALERAPTERPRWRSSLKKAVACICEPVCSGVHDDDVIMDPRKSRRRRRRRRGRDIRSGARSPSEAVLTGESDDYWTFAFRGQGRSSLTDEMLMRRFVLEEDMARRRMEMRAAAGQCWCPPAPSRLSQMSLANDDDNDNGGRSRREQ